MSCVDLPRNHGDGVVFDHITDLNRATAPAIYLDVSRLIWRSWTGRIMTGIDRVCVAYLNKYRSVARAVVQHKGLRRILAHQHSQVLFNLLSGPDEKFRAGLLTLAPFALVASRSTPSCNGGIYLNLGHTDLDLPGLEGWVDKCDLKPIYMIHDLIPLVCPQFCSERAVKRHRGRIDGALAHAAGIIANSESSAQEIREYAQAAGHRLPPLKASWLAGANLIPEGPVPNRPISYFTYVSTMEGRKNHEMLLHVWQKLVRDLGDKVPHLVLIGQKSASFDRLSAMVGADPDMSRCVHILCNCTDVEVAHWVSGARAMLFPSFAEGFGLPVVEALQMGTPVIASDLPCFREIGQNVPTLLDPTDAGAWEEMIRDFTFDCIERDKQIKRIKAFRPPTWAGHFAAVDEWLASLPSCNLHAAPVDWSPVAQKHADRRGSGEYAERLAG